MVQGANEMQQVKATQTPMHYCLKKEIDDAMVFPQLLQ
jgi:hypothetical protein